MFTVYILYSHKFNQIYIGYTSDLPNRFLSHNELATKGHTIKYRPWVIAYTEEYQSKTEAIKRENYLKSTQGRKFARDIIQEKFDSPDG
ncbi:GIY-YIG nuclease family protein [Mucilaginibacter gotjawali]|uniref:Endonuclease n=2 Tax=Mucilaginibacter gotjawali TaxID=1550579 RepID=A0A839SFJ6_9SPHI|nr:GIY-YIG nuclease family protein [Mucilaginibacter gotjawali]MBB3056576.1 putative endonuclease [Mucilaginibacter gotjawali]BAU52720.1 GIY-YIG nuclease superfamily protein [Mucilaginibacter gotjawali]